MKHDAFSRKLKYLAGIAAAILSAEFALAQAPTTSNPPVTADSSNNWLPALRNGHAPNLPANTTMGGSPITGVNDGDKGDITVSGSGVTWTIDTKTISLAKMADMATASFLGRNTAGTSSPEVLSISTVKTMLGIGGTFGTAAYVNTGTTSGTAPLLGTGGHLANATMPLGAQLYDNAGTPVIAADFSSRHLFNSAGSEMIDFDGGELLDASGKESVDFGSQRYLYANDGTTTVLNWSDPTQLGIFGGLVIYANGNIEGNSVRAQLWDGTNVSVSADRQLIANDGSTVALDWSDPTTLIVSGFSINPDGTTNLIPVQVGDASHLFGYDISQVGGQFSPGTDIQIASRSGLIYFDNSGFHGIGSVIAGTKTATGTATTTFTVTIGVTMANTTYKVTTEGDNALSSAVHYVQNKTTTTFDIVYLAGLTGPVSIDWIVSP